ncbi:MAG: Gfo/Idh/MocA family oxidoreductase [Verrucomicrobia bacterium]|nr:Gfo/Idh/MocA family oxidoreductase [Verrucomicrobiota bacterium]
MSATSTPLNIGVLGVGHIGRSHARVYSELGDAGARLALIFDTDRAAAEAVAAPLGARVAASLEDFAAGIDAATVATPTPTHFPLAQFLLERGRHLLVEKPITETTADARALSALAQARGCVLQVGHIERFNPAFGALETLLTRPKFIEAHRLSPYPNRSTDIGVVLDLMIHDLEIILHLVRSKIASVDAVGVPVLSRGEDIANARLRFADGCVANITASRISPEKMRKIRVFQEDAYLSLDYGAQTGEIYRRAAGAITREAVEIEKDEPLKRELASFIECIRSGPGAQPKVTGPQAAAALELAIEITERIAAVNSQ